MQTMQLNNMGLVPMNEMETKNVDGGNVLFSFGLWLGGVILGDMVLHLDECWAGLVDGLNGKNREK